MILERLLKTQGGFRAAFFSWLLCMSAHAHVQRIAVPDVASEVARVQQLALDKGLDSNPRWAALLHLDSEQVPQIRDERFILTIRDFSPRKELLATIAALYGDLGLQAVCRFPARHAWLQKELGLQPLPMGQCQELTEFLTKAPASSISLVFASENLSQPSSMLGHLFLVLRGHRDGRDGGAEHAVSFFTDASSFNLPKLFYESMVTGKPGYFITSPYQGEVHQYLVKEQRTLWEYELKLDDFARALLQQHMHELRHVDIKYFFQRFNCATLVEQMIAIAAPEAFEPALWWTTPKSVVQHFVAADLVTDTAVKTPTRWLIRNAETSLPSSTVYTIKALVDRRQATELVAVLKTMDVAEGFLSLNLAKSYNTYLFEHNGIASEDWRAFNQSLTEVEQRSYADMALEAAPAKNPAYSPKDKQWRMGWRRQAGHDQIQLGVLPVSHTLADDNHQYNSENELRLFDLSVLADVRTGRISLDHFTVYATQSLLPRDGMTGGLSGRFKLGFESQPDAYLHSKTALLIEGALGATERLGSDIDAFALLGGGLGYRDKGYLYVAPTVGVLIREIYDMKTIASVSRTSGALGQPGTTTEISLTQSKYLDAKNTLLVEASRTERRHASTNQLTLAFKRIF